MARSPRPFCFAGDGICTAQLVRYAERTAYAVRFENGGGSQMTENSATDIGGDIAAAAEPLRATLQADGADLEFEGASGSVARFRLVTGPETCHECIVAKPILVGILQTTISKAVPEIATVELDDPRTASTGTTPGG